MGVPKTSIYKPMLDITMGRIVQAGLTKKYMTDELDKVAKANAETLVSLSEKQPLAFEQILGPILLTLILQAACFMVLFLGKQFECT